MDGLGTLLGLISGVNMLRDISVKDDSGSSIYEIGARSKSSTESLKRGSRVVLGARLVRAGREMGIEYVKLGKLLTSVGYSRSEIGAVLDLLRREES